MTKSKFTMRPYMDALTKAHGRWMIEYDTFAGGGRSIGISRLFRGNLPVLATDGYANVGDRYLTVQLNGDGGHRVSHALVTTAAARLIGQPPRFLHWSTPPTPFAKPADMLAAIKVELSRTDHPARQS